MPYKQDTDDTTITSIYDKKGASDGDIEIIDTIEDAHTLAPHEQLEEIIKLMKEK